MIEPWIMLLSWKLSYQTLLLIAERRDDFKMKIIVFIFAGILVFCVYHQGTSGKSRVIADNQCGGRTKKYYLVDIVKWKRSREIRQ